METYCDKLSRDFMHGTTPLLLVRWDHQFHGQEGWGVMRQSEISIVERSSASRSIPACTTPPPLHSPCLTTPPSAILSLTDYGSIGSSKTPKIIMALIWSAFETRLVHLHLHKTQPNTSTPIVSG